MSSGVYWGCASRRKLEELPVVGSHVPLGQVRELKVEEVPGPPQLAGMAEPLIELARMRSVEDRQPIDDLGVGHRERPGGGSAPVVTDDQRAFRTPLPDQTADVGGQFARAVGGDALRLGRQVVPPQVGRDNAEARGRKRRDLPPPAIPELREAVEQNEQRTVAGLNVMQPYVPGLSVAFPNLGLAV
jgi:hypothetical protein